MGYLPLQIETGRYTNTPAANRICKLCHLEIEDQYHFLLICPLLRQERLHLFNAIAKLDSNANFMVMNPSEKLYILPPELRQSYWVHLQTHCENV